MVVFRHPDHRLRLAQILGATESGRGLEWVMANARLEQALSDFWCPDRDDWKAEQVALAGRTLAAAARYLGLPGLPAPPLPQLPPADTALPVGEPEGLRFYALWPPGWTQAVAHWHARSPEPVWVLGLRTMGSLLAPMAALGLTPSRDLPHRLATLRPRGHASDRCILATPRLQAQVRAWPGLFLIVDEGPGLSGSSFGGTMRWLQELGVSTQRVILFASWRPPAGQLTSPYAQDHWDHWQVLVAEPLPSPAGRDLSGGAWRAAFGRWGPVWPEHERRKILLHGGTAVAKFAGLGPWGQTVRDRACALARAHWTPDVVTDLAPGWIGYRCLPARRARLDRAWAETAGRYLAWRAASFPLGYGPPSPELRAMVAANLSPRAARSAPDGPWSYLDAHILAIEWVQTADGWRKLDATDHGDDPFFPGPADVAWDLAALTVEFPPALAAAALLAYTRVSGDGGRGLALRVHWHVRAYLAFRQAYCQLAAERTCGRDAQAFRRLARCYRVCSNALKP